LGVARLRTCTDRIKSPRQEVKVRVISRELSLRSQYNRQFKSEITFRSSQVDIVNQLHSAPGKVTPVPNANMQALCQKVRKRSSSSVSLSIQRVKTRSPHLLDLLSKQFLPQFTSLFCGSLIWNHKTGQPQCRLRTKRLKGTPHRFTKRYQPRWAQHACWLQSRVSVISYRFHLQYQPLRPLYQQAMRLKKCFVSSCSPAHIAALNDGVYGLFLLCLNFAMDSDGDVDEVFGFDCCSALAGVHHDHFYER
jgi:hypothetical protein